jgi:hypothetical protein
MLLIVPKMSEAAVVLSEVAWMGSAASANHEWIELYNNGTVENVDGWILSDGMNLSIELTGSIPGTSYAVLERTSDDTVSGTAFLIYTGALVNTGATLTLKRSDGSIVDQVAGGENWVSIGGDNVTKETAQYTSGGWVTAIPTPGASNTTETNIDDEEEEQEEEGDDNEDEEVEEDKDTVTSSGTRSASPIVLKKVPGEPTVRINMPATVYVNQAVEAVATVSDIGKTIDQSMERAWNFGDLGTATGKEVMHRFMYPGEYIVSVRAVYKNFIATDKVVVKVLPMNLSVTKNTSGDIQIHNDAKYEIDVSGYEVRAKETVVIPDDTYLRASATLTVPRSRLGNTNQIVVVSDEVGKPLVYFNPSDQQTTQPVASMPPEVMAFKSNTSVPVHDTQTESVFRFSGESVIGSSSTTTVARTTSLEPNLPPFSAALPAALPLSQKQSPYPYFGLIGIIGIAVLAVVSSRTKVVTRSVETEPVPLVEDDPFPFR